MKKKKKITRKLVNTQATLLRTQMHTSAQPKLTSKKKEIGDDGCFLYYTELAIHYLAHSNIVHQDLRKPESNRRLRQNVLAWDVVYMRPAVHSP